ncbi:hypothetical protein [Nocardia vaccinii]|uniref:hypothetical protein n=1 Tax=Nocardia vaccinii TaxID=1822 RepID=UPI000836056F|nr:hypothetical protein [Nocardia vaccinii]
MVSVEKILIVHYGNIPDQDELQRLLQAVGLRAGFDPTDVPAAAVEAVGGHRATVVNAYAAALSLENRGQLRRNALKRTGAYIIDAGVEQRVGAVVWDSVAWNETNAWVRELIPIHLERAEREDPELARQRSWIMLEDEPAMAFVARARDGEGLRFDDVYIAVSQVTETAPQRIRKLMPGGFLEWSSGVLNGLGAPVGELDIAHWVVATDHSGNKVLHLAYFARGRHALLPTDLIDLP